LHEFLEIIKIHNSNFKINRVDFTQLLMDSKIEDHEELKKKEKVDLAQFRLDREISFEV
jgi:hypothetical protein